MAKALTIPIQFTLDAKAAEQAVKAIQGVDKATLAAQKSAAASAQALARNDAATARSAQSAQKLATAQNQTAISAAKVAQAQSAAAAQAARTEQAILRLAQAQERAARGGDSLSQSVSKLVQAAGTLGIAFGAQQIIQGGIALAQTGAQAEQTATRFQQLAAAAGQSGDQILAALQKASGGQISDLNLQLAANRANLLGVATSAEELGTLMAIARDRAQSLGTTATDAFNDLVTGLGRGSPLILDNLGIMVNLGAANEAYAASVGKTVAQLTDAEKKQALINQVVADGKASLEQTGGAAETTAGKFTALGTAAENAGTKLGQALANSLSDAAKGGTVVLDALIKRFEEMGEAQAKLGDNDALVRASDNYAQYNAQVQALSRETGNAYANIGALTEAQFLQAKISQTGSTASQDHAAGIQQVGAAAQTTTAATSALATVLDDEAQKALVNSVNSQALTVEKEKLTAAAQNAAGAVLAAGGNIEAEAARLAASSSLIDQLTAAYLRLAAANGQAANAQRLAGQAAQTRTLATPGAGAVGRKGNGDDAIAGVVAQQQAIKDTAEAQRKYNEQVGGSKVVLANLRADLTKANLTEAQRIDILTKIAQVEGSASKAGGARATAAAGVARKLVDIEQAAADKIVAINQKMMEQQEAAARKLAGSIATTTADMIADQEANDLDLIGAKEENIAKLQAREAAEANARIAQSKAVAEAQATAAAGDAALAEDVLNIRESAIQKQAALDEEYNNRRNELAGDETASAALKQQYDEATQAAADATAVRVGLAQSEADQKKQAVEAEKQAALAAAAEAGNALLDTGQEGQRIGKPGQ